MTSADGGAAAAAPRDVAELRTMGKVFRRLIWFLFALYVVNFLDRINIGFAALSMNRALGLTETMFGLSSMILNAAYLSFAIPSNLLMARFGARRWISIILIGWGLASMATVFATGPKSLYVLRFLVGLTEGGFLPGIMLYLTYWFPRSQRARATALFLMAQPVSIALGAPISGLILGMPQLGGIAPWRWLFLLEGLPAVVLGMVAIAYLRDRPADALWLSPGERLALARRIVDEDRVGGGAQPRRRGWAELRGRNVVLISIAYFTLVASLSASSTWLPQITQEVLHGSRNFPFIGVVTALPALCALAAMPLWGALADRLDRPIPFTIAPMIVAGFGWAAIASLDNTGLRILGLMLGSVGSLTAFAVFWTLPSACLSPAGRPAGIGLVTAVGISAGFVSPYVIGMLRDLTRTYAASLWYVIMALALGCALLSFVTPSRGPAGAA